MIGPMAHGRSRSESRCRTCQDPPIEDTPTTVPIEHSITNPIRSPMEVRRRAIGRGRRPRARARRVTLDALGRRHGGASGRLGAPPGPAPDEVPAAPE